MVAESKDSGPLKLQVACVLEYEISAPLTMLLNVRAQNASAQRVLREHFSLSSRMPHALLECGVTGTRFDRIEVEVPGVYTVRYDAEIELRAERMPAERLGPADPGSFDLGVLSYLYPSRYCQSDRLGRLTAEEF
jgi:hypothetical protein